MAGDQDGAESQYASPLLQPVGMGSQPVSPTVGHGPSWHIQSAATECLSAQISDASDGAREGRQCGSITPGAGCMGNDCGEAGNSTTFTGGASTSTCGSGDRSSIFSSSISFALKSMAPGLFRNSAHHPGNSIPAASARSSSSSSSSWGSSIRGSGILFQDEAGQHGAHPEHATSRDEDAAPSTAGCQEVGQQPSRMGTGSRDVSEERKERLEAGEGKATSRDDTAPDSSSRPRTQQSFESPVRRRSHKRSPALSSLLPLALPTELPSETHTPPTSAEKPDCTRTNRPFSASHAQSDTIRGPSGLGFHSASTATLEQDGKLQRHPSPNRRAGSSSNTSGNSTAATAKVPVFF